MNIGKWFVRILAAIIIGIVIGFIVWFIGFIIITFLPVTTSVVALGQLFQFISYFAGVLGGIWFLIVGYKKFPSLI